jgi:hypothetical protein
MKRVTYKYRDYQGVSPLFATRCVEHTESVICAKIVPMGNLMQLYNQSGYTIFSLSPSEIVKIEEL